MPPTITLVPYARRSRGATVVVRARGASSVLTAPIASGRCAGAAPR